MAGSRRGRKAKKRPPSSASAGLLAQGAEGGPLRTPRHIGDQFANHDEYEVEYILAEQLIRGVPRYHIQWLGIPPESNTWEPEEHLLDSHSQGLLKAFRERREEEAKVS